jgi:hypothetical protein
VSEVKDKNLPVLLDLFEDKEVNKITNYVEGSEVIALLEIAREENTTYELFSRQIEDNVKVNKGKPNENLLKKLYLKYVLGQGSSLRKSANIEVVNSYIMDLINNCKYSEDVKEVDDILNNYKQDNMITTTEYNYLSQKLREKESEILDGI